MAIQDTSPFKPVEDEKPPAQDTRKKLRRGDVEAALKDARWKILQNRRQLAKTLLDLAENVENVLKLSAGHRRRGSAQSHMISNENLSPQAVNVFLAETGLFPRDVKMFRGFSKTLGKHRDLLIKQAVQFDTIKALIAASDETRTEALTRIAAGANLSPRQIRHIESEFQILASTADQREFRAYDAKLNRGAVKLARKNAEEFRSAIGAFVCNFVEFEKLRKLVPSQLDNMKNLARTGIVNMERFDAMRENLAMEARALLTWFDKLFPGMGIKQEDWFDLPPCSAELLLAKARYLLSQTSHGNVWVMSTEFSEFLELGGLNTLRRLCEMPLSNTPDQIQRPPEEDGAKGNAPRTADTPFRGTRAASNAVSPTNPVRRYSAVEIFSASGAAALGLEAASFRIAALSKESAFARTTIWANRPDWVVAEDAAALSIKDAISAGLKTKRVDVICGALPGRPWHRKNKGAEDEEHSFPKVISLIRDIRPEGFFFENAGEFLDARHALYKNEIIQEFSALGYVAEFFLIQGQEYGLAQTRNRTVIMGVKRSANRQLVPPVIEPGVYCSVVEVLEELINSPECSDKERSAYVAWRNISEKRPISTPDLYSLINPYPAVLRKWRKVGFECDDLLSPLKTRGTRKDKPESVPLTIPVLKALQGIPAHWTFDGSERDQAEQIALTTPPALMRVYAQAMHATLTGGLVDLSDSLKEPFSVPEPTAISKRAEGTPARGFKKQIPNSLPTYLFDDPQAEKSRRYRAEQEILNGPSWLNDDENIRLNSSSR